ncbi:acylphosphatase [Staphylococcus sp. SQ8-PEA]|uniref:acylphosphatase n=1 Tax=Staphylococcus marylandisciuri TaxID=2981529 RepID=A0ABT2QNK8_9STAP|nr:acylphosphatase [Staphylococcus marylandisciuri]MCU5745539.1 acylphosphatase [Staphylococcus marylandisciuri]
MERKHMKVYGTVQGVGFRYYTQKIAKKYSLVGTVQNVEDYVEIYAQGEAQSLEQFINEVKNGASPASKVESYDVEDVDVDHSLQKFKTI